MMDLPIVHFTRHSLVSPSSVHIALTMLQMTDYCTTASFIAVPTRPVHYVAATKVGMGH